MLHPGTNNFMHALVLILHILSGTKMLPNPALALTDHEQHVTLLPLEEGRCGGSRCRRKGMKYLGPRDASCF